MRALVEAAGESDAKRITVLILEGIITKLIHGVGDQVSGFSGVRNLQIRCETLCADGADFVAAAEMKEPCRVLSLVAGARAADVGLVRAALQKFPPAAAEKDIEEPLFK
eukprot:3220508-Alexandrium_andersonii.AAC.1